MELQVVGCFLKVGPCQIYHDLWETIGLWFVSSFSAVERFETTFGYINVTRNNTKEQEEEFLIE